MPLLPHLGWAKPWVIIITARLPGHLKNDHPFWTLTCHNRACVDEVLQAAEPSPAVTRIRVFKPGEFGGMLGAPPSGFNPPQPACERARFG